MIYFWHVFLYICFVVVPLRNGHYFDALGHLQASRSEIDAILHDYAISDTDASFAKLQELVANRCTAVDYNLFDKTYSCLGCRERWRDVNWYIFHECGFDSSNDEPFGPITTPTQSQPL